MTKVTPYYSVKNDTKIDQIMTKIFTAIKNKVKKEPVSFTGMLLGLTLFSINLKKSLAIKPVSLLATQTKSSVMNLGLIFLFMAFVFGYFLVTKKRELEFKR